MIETMFEKEVVKLLGVSRQSLHTWRKKDKSFADCSKIVLGFRKYNIDKLNKWREDNGR
jgi:hypothetical protein